MEFSRTSANSSGTEGASLGIVLGLGHVVVGGCGGGVVRGLRHVVVIGVGVGGGAVGTGHTSAAASKVPTS